MNEGYIKFGCNWEQNEILITDELFSELGTCRSRLFELGLIGMSPDRIGFGNISVRMGKDPSFIITGSATGQFASLNQVHYSLVTGYDFEKNSISCKGLTKASAESLTHASIYEVLPETGAVVHIHCLWLWEKLLHVFPTTSSDIEYGTPEMAYAVNSLASKMRLNREKIIIMGGHREGILAFGSSLTETTSLIIDIFNRYKHD